MNQGWTPEAVRALRARLKLSQAQLAERIGCSRQAVYLWENGERKPQGLYAQALDRIAQEDTDDE